MPVKLQTPQHRPVDQQTVQEFFEGGMGHRLQWLDLQIDGRDRRQGGRL
jgi:hypothetical protein